MAWLVLFASGLLETVWAISLKQSDGFSRPGWVALFLVSATLSLVGLAIALRTLPVGSAYAVWTGIGAVGAAIVGVVALGETASLLRGLGIVLILGGIVALRMAGVE